MLTNDELKKSIFETINFMDSIYIDNLNDIVLPYDTFLEEKLYRGGSAFGSAFQEYLLLILNKQNRTWRAGKGREPDFVNLIDERYNFELKTTLGNEITGNKTSNTTKHKIESCNFVFVYVDKEEGSIRRIETAILLPSDWICSNGNNTQISHPDKSKLQIIYEREDI